MLKTRLLLSFAAVIAAASGGLRPLHAQSTTGAIAGVITGDGGSAIDGAQVRVVNTSTGTVINSTSRAGGRYTVAGLEVGGPYTVMVRRIGFQPVTHGNIMVTLGVTQRVDFQLLAQAATLATVNVTGAADNAVITPAKTGVGTTISDSALHRLPTLDRNFTDFVTLVPQVSTTIKSGSGIPAGLSGGGVNNRYNQIQVDGVGENDLFGLGATGQPGGQAGGKSIGLESVKEYQILLSPFDVRQGNFVGLLVNAVTKSGTNNVDGSAYFFGRSQSFTRSQPYIRAYDQSQFGIALGGPIVKDKAFFFINPEFQRESTPATGYYFGAPGSNLTQASLDRFTGDLNQLGIPTGSAGQITNKHPLTNIFGRLDFNLPWNSTLVLRDNYGEATQDAFSRGSGGSAPNFPLSSQAYQYTSKKNNIGGQLRTNFSNGAFNEVLLGVTSVRDNRLAAMGASPMVTVLVPGQASLVAGAERYSQGPNIVNQDITELTDNYTYPIGSHSVTLGAQATLYKAADSYPNAVGGVWGFGNLDSLELGLPNSYIVGVPTGGDGSYTVHSRTYAAYLEDVWSTTNRFSLTYGLRLDVPTFGDRPPVNQDILTQFGRNTSEIPSGKVQYSPRIGFNWDVTGDQRNQLRGGIGSFVGHPAFVWLGNAFQNSGFSGFSLLTCTRSRGDVMPVLNATTAANPPSSCGSKTASAGGEIDLLSKDLRFPQDVRASLGYDHELGTSGVIATLEGLYSHAIYAPFYQNIALAGPQGVDVNGRVMYGPQPSRPVLKVSTRNAVYDVTNSNKDYSYDLTAGLQRRFRTNWSGSVFYTYSASRDVQSITSSTAASNYQYARRWAGNLLDQTATRSDFDQPHRIVAQGTRSFRTHTDVSLTYIGSSGTPYDYNYYSDMNGDGNYSNDPIYVPKNATDPNEIRFSDIKSGSTVTHTAAAEATAFENFIASTPCLNDNRGRILPRNACRYPWSNQLNLSLRQSLPIVTGQRASVQLDVINLLNLMNRNWGHQAFTYTDVTLLYAGNTLVNSKGSLIQGASNLTQPLYQFTPGAQPKPDFNNIESNYQLQLSFRYSF